MNARALGLVVVAAAAVAGVVAAAPADAATTISGSLGGGTLPAKGAGVASVRAVALETGVIVADARVRSGRFALRVPAGAYVLLATTTPLRGHAGVDRKVDALRVASGASRRLRLSLRRRGGHAARRRKARAAAGPSFVSVTYPAVWVQHFTVSGPDEYSVLGKGLADMLINDAGPAIKKRCDGVLVEREHLDLIIAEQKLSQSRYGDPATRIPSGHLIGHNRVVTGTLTVTGATATLTVTVTNTATGLKRSVTRSGTSGAGIFDLEKSVVDDVAKMVCDPPERYVGPVSGSIPASAGSATGTFAWSGELTLALDHVGPAPAGSPDGEYGFYRPVAGTIHLTLDMVDGHCAGHGETDLSVDPSAGDDSWVQAGVENPAYTLYAAFGASPGIAFAWTGGTDEDPCANNGTLPFGAGLPALATGTRQATSSTLAGSTTDLFPGAGSVHREWSLVPQG